jgi:16S rRNA (guanine527-N7)-methyltransferase
LKGEKTIDHLIRRGFEESGLGRCEDSAIRELAFYTDELERWNRKMNLTGKRTGEAIVADLLYDAFFVYGCIKDKRSVLDMGSGAGVMSIPFAILGRGVHVVSVDASTKKIQFQRHVRRVLGLDNLTLFASRIEELEPQGVEIVVAKAVGPTEDLLNWAGRHLSGRGAVILVKGKSEPETDFPGFALESAERYRLSGSAKEFKLITYKKVP